MRKIVVLLALLLSLSIPFTASDSDAEDVNDRLLVDYGNGCYEWFNLEADPGVTLHHAVSATLESNGIAKTVSGTSFISVNGISNTMVGTQACSWRYYIWDTYSWAYGSTEGGEKYCGGCLALAYTPSEAIVPVSTPYYPDTWACARGDSGSSAVSGSEGLSVPATPLEWYVKSDTGGVYSSILAADGLVYYLTGGDFYGTGVNRNPHVYCVDTVNQEVAWSFTYSINLSSGASEYELNTPVLLGDMIIITSSNRHVYCLDRFEGTVLSELFPQGEKAHFPGPFNTEYQLGSGPDQITFKGVSTAVYDSGALFFITSDGVLHGYGIERDGTSAKFVELWKSIPSSSGYCMLSPCIMDLNGIRVVVTSDTGGRILCFRIDDGTVVRSFAPSVGGYGICKIVPAGNGKIVVTSDDGSMIPKEGTMSVVDMISRKVVWSVPVFPYMHGIPTVVEDTIYAYLMPTIDSGLNAQVWDKYHTYYDAKPGYYAMSVTDGHVIWNNFNDNRTRCGMTYCDGRLYCVDYSTLAEWPTGGALRCIDPDTGNLLWSVKLEPGSSLAYNMSAPTIIGGKVYVGNDDGTLYCISDIPGKKYTETSDIDYESQGLMHWSWMLLFSIAIVTAAASVIMYRK